MTVSIGDSISVSADRFAAEGAGTDAARLVKMLVSFCFESVVFNDILISSNGDIVVGAFRPLVAANLLLSVVLAAIFEQKFNDSSKTNMEPWIYIAKILADLIFMLITQYLQYLI